MDEKRRQQVLRDLDASRQRVVDSLLRFHAYCIDLRRLPEEDVIARWLDDDLSGSREKNFKVQPPAPAGRGAGSA